ncbi:hydantoinase B/oxoprolinase family protein [Hydrogenophaga sp. BPS33]|uniref:hydantoinase B/oxoprolinase family protein n=1 Tax=Hydrogenophaga sp. BPS33 TaxID=2651974 RepID=UPI00131FBAE7|nr:hydantoinase B/oxoprolinase family protein [Hydrogenophaga sp. BPS33]QHE84687.1 hydantoinase B/oxoprolinase family protein [Hydrogenophaga sp. BPS33]
MTTTTVNLKLEVIWARLASIVDEAATALVRTCFSTVIRDSNDYGCQLFDENYNLIAQSTLGTPGFLGALPHAMKQIGALFPPETLSPGDILATNDPWMCTGHLNDITVVTPIFNGSKIIAYAICTAHEADIGGRIAVSETKEVFEEGLFIPPMKLVAAGVEDATAFRFIRANVRQPAYVVGDVRAQISSNEVMARRTLDLLSEYGLADLTEVSAQILQRTSSAVAAKIANCKEGTYVSEATIDAYDGKPVHIKVAVTVRDGRVLVDYAGTTSQIERGVNVCYPYTLSYTVFALKCALSPLLPNNEGVLRLIDVRAPEGSILNAKYPAPVNSRASIAQFLPEIILGALAQAIPSCAMAASGGAPIWVQRFSGVAADGKKFLLFCAARGGLGGRSTADGVSALAFPSNTVPTPVEVQEADGPVIFECKELTPNSAGAGEFRGGFGQHIAMKIAEGARSPQGSVIVSAKGGRLHYAVPGVRGGLDAPLGRVAVNGEPFTVSGRQVVLGPGDRLELHLPGGGGFGNPLRRDPESVASDVSSGLVSIEQARNVYGVVFSRLGLDRAETEKLRADRMAATQ